MLNNSTDDVMQKFGFTIQDDATAEWAISKIVDAEAEIKRWQDYYDSQMEKIRTANEGTIAFMMAKLETYFDSVPHRVTKTLERYHLPSGDLVRKKGRQVLKHDDAALLEWIRENGLVSECVKVKESVAWEKVKQRLKVDADGVVCDAETGVVCDAVTVSNDEPRFVVRLAGVDITDESNESNDAERVCD